MGIKNEIKSTIVILGVASILFGYIALITNTYKNTQLNLILFKIGIVSVTLLGVFVIKMIFDIFIRNRYKIKIDYKNMPEEFLDFYNEINNKDNILLNDKKNKALTVLSTIHFLIIVSVTCLIYSLINFSKTAQENVLEIKGFPGIFLLLVIVVIIFKLYKVKKQRENEYRYSYKEEILNRLVSLIDRNFKYYPIEKKVEKENFYYINDNIVKEDDSDYLDSGLEKEVYNFYNLKSKITNINDKFSLEELDLKYKKRVKGKRFRINVYSFYVFKGFFVRVNTNKNIKAIIRIRKNKLIFKKYNMKISNKEFEKYFDVYAKGVNDINSIFTESMINLLIDFYKKYKINYELTIKNDKLYVRFEMGSLFEPKVYGKLFNKKHLYRYYYYTKAIKEFAENINNNLI